MRTKLTIIGVLNSVEILTPRIQNNFSLQDLRADLKSELSGNFEDLVLALLDSPTQFDIKQLHGALSVRNPFSFLKQILLGIILLTFFHFSYKFLWVSFLISHTNFVGYNFVNVFSFLIQILLGIILLTFFSFLIQIL